MAQVLLAYQGIVSPVSCLELDNWSSGFGWLLEVHCLSMMNIQNRKMDFDLNHDHAPFKTNMERGLYVHAVFCELPYCLHFYCAGLLYFNTPLQRRGGILHYLCVSVCPSFCWSFTNFCLIFSGKLIANALKFNTLFVSVCCIVGSKFVPIRCELFVKWRLFFLA